MHNYTICKMKEHKSAFSSKILLINYQTEQLNNFYCTMLYIAR